MPRLQFTDAAERDLIEIALFIAAESRSRALAAAFVERLRAKCRHLSSLSATLGTARADLGTEIRSTPAQGYVIFFRYRENTIEVINILHGSRDVIRHFRQ